MTPTTKVVSQPLTEIELHYKRPPMEKLVQITNSDEANTYIRTYINPNRLDLKEFFWVMYLTHNNQVLGCTEIASGKATSVCVNIREIFQIALMTNATSIILVHNHTSGSLVISVDDREFTKKIQDIAVLFDISLLDHLIITSESYCSFNDEEVL